MHQQKKINSNWKHLCTDSIKYLPTHTAAEYEHLLFNYHTQKGKGIRWSCKFLRGVSYFSDGGKKMKKKKDVDHFPHCFVSLVQVALYISGRTCPLTQELDNASCLLKGNWHLSLKHHKLRLESFINQHFNQFPSFTYLQIWKFWSLLQKHPAGRCWRG